MLIINSCTHLTEEPPFPPFPPWSLIFSRWITQRDPVHGEAILAVDMKPGFWSASAGRRAHVWSEPGAGCRSLRTLAGLTGLLRLHRHIYLSDVLSQVLPVPASTSWGNICGQLDAPPSPMRSVKSRTSAASGQSLVAVLSVIPLCSPVNHSPESQCSAGTETQKRPETAEDGKKKPSKLFSIPRGKVWKCFPAR